MNEARTDELAILYTQEKVDSIAFTDSTFQQLGIGGKDICPPSYPACHWLIKIEEQP